MSNVLTSNDNPRVRLWSKLARSARFRRAQSSSWLEGFDFVAEYIGKLGDPTGLIVSDAALKRHDVATLVAEARCEVNVVSHRVFEHISLNESPAGVAAVIETRSAPVHLDRPCVFLEGLQDPGNVGTLLRSAAAFGLTQAVLDRSCADPWSPRCLRAGAGAQLYQKIQVCESILDVLKIFEGERLCTVVRGGEPLRRSIPSRAQGWIFGNEGSGASDAVRALADRLITIPILAGTESLNVASAAAICFYESRSR